MRLTQTDPIVIVGAGPAGMMAAIRASRIGRQVVLVEKNAVAGAKLLLSGKGRCNLTNASGLEDFLERFSGNGQFLRDAFKKFFNTELIHFFQSRGLELTTERQQRVFPATGRSSGILEVLLKELQTNHVAVRYKTPMVNLMVRGNEVCGVELAGGNTIATNRVILATGGVSYPGTGSTGDGMRWAQKYGHRIVVLRPGLVALVTKKEAFRLLAGLTLKNIRLVLRAKGKEISTEIGELLFTDFGISGPLVLTHSGSVADWLMQGKDVSVHIDYKPALSKEQLDQRVLRECKANPRKNIASVLKELLPVSLVGVFLARLGIPKDKKANQITATERKRIIGLLHDFPLEVKATRPIAEAMVTKGGVSLQEIDPRTMESRLVKGLYFCGEMIDIDADTGGFNLQAAFSTGYLAGESAAQDLNNQ